VDLATNIHHVSRHCSQGQRSKVKGSDRMMAGMSRIRPFCVFEPPLGGGLEATYDGHLRLIGKRVVDFLLVLIELFLPAVTAESLPASIGS